MSSYPGMPLNDCDLAMRDIAAVSEATLSRRGAYRLARHVKRCCDCRLVLAITIVIIAPVPLYLTGIN